MDSIEAMMSQYGAKPQEPLKETSETITLRSPSPTPVDCAQPLATEEFKELDKANDANPPEDAIDMGYQGTNTGELISEEIHCNNMGVPAENSDSQDQSEMCHDFQLSPPQATSPSERRVADPEEAPSLDTDSSPGQVRYYGPTTQLHIQSYSDRSTSISTTNDILSTSDFIVDMDGPQLREILMNSCWSYYSRSVRVVDPQLFMAHRAVGKRSQYYSRFLEEALLACATRISTSQAVLILKLLLLGTELDGPIVFCGIQIVLHRAVVKILSQEESRDSNANSAHIEQSRGIMYDSAACICRLTLAYREIFGLENFITVMLDNMYIAAKTVVALQNHHPVAEKMSRTLSRITENTTLSTYFGPATGRNFTFQSMDKPVVGSFLPAIGGSWGSMEALVHDDFILIGNLE
ncbi:hypothetical protein G7Z17_g2712 [Cylindrodendrum hubeiense]|uniref:Uncharacterized protein n=1 Tax=Cylindrodendrum hubeiense TaxID=595255 RepID=A0A9P5LKR8_9HYPO|nr:hypothetical protein G7Z17_g2712 [Cylindrodendrum hubeiense]